ncbi:MAG TPA: hypothetical protein PLG66_10830 [Calditrichia bacterium]|nr:hypothetical protein [Calditrichia bacterium]
MSGCRGIEVVDSGRQPADGQRQTGGWVVDSGRQTGSWVVM